MRIHFFIVMFLISGLLLAKEPFNAYVESTTIAEGDSFTLTLELEGASSDKPDLSPLSEKFDIIGQSMSSESTYINGVSNKKTKWILECRPKTAQAKLLIPSIKLGAYNSKPIEITQGARHESKGTPSLSLVATTTSNKVYVNGEIILNLELKTTLPLRNGNLGKPEIKDAIIEPLVEDDNRETTQNGVRTFIFHRSYAIYPAKAGELVIPSINFEGLVADASARGWFSQGRRMSARSKALSIKVQDIPANYPKGQPFLPLKSLAVIESFDSDDPKFEVNKATTRRFEIKALGTLSSFLPVIEAPQQPGLKVYTETGLKVHKNTEDGLEASVKFSHVYMPTHAGTVTIPEHTIYWWDTDKDELRTTVMRSFSFEAHGGSTGVPQPAAEKNTPELQPEKTDAQAQGIHNWWPWIAAAFACLWVFTMAAWFMVRSKRNPPKAPDAPQALKEAINDVVAAATAKDARLTYARLQTLRSMAVKGELSPQAIVDINALNSELEALLYGGGDPVKLKEVLQKVVAYLISLKAHPQANQKLSELYPG